MNWAFYAISWRMSSIDFIEWEWDLVKHEVISKKVVVRRC